VRSRNVFSVLLCFVVYKDIDLTNPELGGELLRNARGDLPLDVWEKYFWEHSRYRRPVLAWREDPSDPDPRFVPVDPQQAVDWAIGLVGDTINYLPNSPEEALMTAKRAWEILVRGTSECQPKRGQAATMRPIAVRAYIIRKFNPHPNKPDESIVTWAKLADILFVNNRECSRKIREKGRTRTCGLGRHQYDSACVKALITAVTRLHIAMKHDGIPV